MELYKLIQELKRISNQQIDVGQVYTTNNGNIAVMTTNGEVFIITKTGVYKHEPKRR